MEGLLARVKDKEPKQLQVRVTRALEALERSGAKEAVAVLELLAKEAPEAELRNRAKVAAVHLSKRAAR